MKIRLPLGLCIALAAALVVFGLLYGTWSGFREDQAEVAALLESENGLMDVLDYRAADGFNLCAVAQRHLSPDDADLRALEDAARALRSAEALEARQAADAALSAAAAAVGARLETLPSFQQSPRDQGYLRMLENDLDRLASSAALTTYNQAAQAFNDRLAAPPMGALAQLLGVRACPLYE